MHARLRATVPAILVLLGAQALLLRHLAVVPAWEAPDEPWHLAYAEALAVGHPPTAAETYEYHHPPGAYLWTALALRGLGWEALPRGAYEPRFPLAANAYLHPPDDPGASRLRLLRAWNGLLLAPALALAWAAARRLRRRRRGPPAAVAAALVFLLPMTPFTAATVTNDTAALLAGAWLWYLAACHLAPRRAIADRVRDPRRAAVAGGLLLGTAVVLAAAVKMNALVFAAVPVGAVLLGTRTKIAGRPHARSEAALLAALELLVAAASAALLLTLLSRLPLLAGLARLPAQLLQRSSGGRLLHPGWTGDLLRLLDSTAGVYGWLNVVLDPWLRRLVLVGGATALLLGLSPTMGPRRLQDSAVTGPARLLAAAGLLLLVAATLGNAASDPAALQGRLLLPALPAAAWLAAVGVERLARAMDIDGMLEVQGEMGRGRSLDGAPSWGSVWPFGSASPNARGQSSPGLFHRDVPTGQGTWRHALSRVAPALSVGAVFVLLVPQVVATGWLLPAAYGGPVNDAPLLLRGTVAEVSPGLRLSAGGIAEETFTVAAPLRLRRLELGVIVGRGPGRLRLSLWREPGAGGSAATLLARAEAPLDTLGRRSIDDPPRIGPLADTSWLGVDLPGSLTHLDAGTTLRARVELLEATREVVIRKRGSRAADAAVDTAWLWTTGTGEPVESGVLQAEPAPDAPGAVAWLAYGDLTTEAPR